VLIGWQCEACQAPAPPLPSASTNVLEERSLVLGNEFKAYENFGVNCSWAAGEAVPAHLRIVQAWSASLPDMATGESQEAPLELTCQSWWHFYTSAERAKEAKSTAS
jgi:hypothetical protein